MLDLGEVYGVIVAELRANRPLRDSMDLIISRCEAARPHRDWARLRRLPYDDLSELSQWIQTPFRLDPPAKPLAGLWYGLCNPINEDGFAVADIHVCGSLRFEPDPMTNEWAVGPEWCPKHSYAHSAVLASVYDVAYRKNGLANDAEYPLCLAYGALAVRDLLNAAEPKVILGATSSLGVAVGFDSGDFVLLGRFTARGLIPLKPKDRVD